MKKIPLSQGKFALVDDSDYEELNKWKWFAWKDGNTFYAVRHSKCNPNTHKQGTLYMHRVIMQTPKGMDTDHISRDGLDNRRDNLRVCTKAENGRNRRIQSNNTSGFKGVYFHNRDKKWRAKICVDGKAKHIGTFNTPELAHIAYCYAAKLLHGSFAHF